MSSEIMIDIQNVVHLCFGDGMAGGGHLSAENVDMVGLNARRGMHVVSLMVQVITDYQISTCAAFDVVICSMITFKYDANPRSAADKHHMSASLHFPAQSMRHAQILLQTNSSQPQLKQVHTRNNPISA